MSHPKQPNTDANSRQVGGSHYQRQVIQHWDYVLANNIPYMEAQIIKYVSRWRDKNGIQDLEKAAHFLQKLIEHNTEPPREKTQRYGEFVLEDTVDDFATYSCKKCGWRAKIPVESDPLLYHGHCLEVKSADQN